MSLSLRPLALQPAAGTNQTTSLLHSPFKDEFLRNIGELMVRRKVEKTYASTGCLVSRFLQRPTPHPLNFVWSSVNNNDDRDKIGFASLGFEAKSFNLQDILLDLTSS